MRDHQTIRKTTLLAGISLVCLVGLGASPPGAHASWQSWAQHWRHNATRAHSADNRCRAAASARLLRPCCAYHDARLPAGAGTDWPTTGRAWRARAHCWWGEAALRLHRMEHPGGSGASRWWPLASWAGWSRGCRAMWCKVVGRESGGSATAGGPPGASGLMQIDPPCRDWQNPLANIRAGLRKYRDAIRRGLWGWTPWSQTAY
jgi:hypothetical protein